MSREFERRVEILELFVEAARPRRGRKIRDIRYVSDLRRMRHASAVAEHELSLRVALRRGVVLVRAASGWAEVREGRSTLQAGRVTVAKVSTKERRRVWREERTRMGLCWHCPAPLARSSRTCCEGCLAKRKG